MPRLTPGCLAIAPDACSAATLHRCPAVHPDRVPLEATLRPEAGSIATRDVELLDGHTTRPPGDRPPRTLGLP